MPFELDHNIFFKQKSLGDYLAEEEDRQMKRDLMSGKLSKMMSGGDDPAAIQVANEMQKALESGDMVRYNLLAQTQKIWDKGVTGDGMGNAGVIDGYAGALGNLAYGKQSGQNQSDLEYKPSIAGGEAKARLGQQLTYEPQINAANKAANMKAESQTQAEIDLPKVTDQSQQMLDLLDQIGTHKGMSAVVGMPDPTQGRMPFIGNIAGSPAADFQAKLDQLGGKQFLEAFQTLKGGGQITEVEGTKATNAIATMQSSQSEEQFLKSLGELKSVVNQGLRRAQNKALVPNTSSNVFDGVSQENPPDLPPAFRGLDSGVSPAPPKASKARAEAEFKLRKQGFTQEEINEYLGSN